MGQKYKDLATRRTTGTRMTGCKFTCDIIRIINKDGERWEVRVSDPAHNHGPDLHPSTQPAHRKRSEAARKLIKVLQAANLSPKDILNILIKHDPEANYTRVNISNEVTRARHEELDGLTPTQALFVALEVYNIEDENLENRYIYWYHRDDKEQVDYLFFVHPKSRELLCKHPDVLLIDSTYSTNRYNMPLAYITGHTSQNGSFDIGYAFIAAERTEHYGLLIQHLSQLWRDDLDLFPPQIIITDKEKALKNALRVNSFFSNVPQILCQWYTQ